MSGIRSFTPSSQLPEEIRAALRADHELWYPGLAARLVQDFERQWGEEGWRRDTYGTQRWIVRDPAAPRVERGVVNVGRRQSIVEVLPPSVIRSETGIPPLVAWPPPEAAEQMQSALEGIASLDGLAESLGCLICSCHVLAAKRGYDVSHTTPALPLSIFISIPAPDERHAKMRLAESVIHEAMHLQLTLIESTVRLVEQADATAFSPWKQTARPVQGVLHGLYVFAVIHEALKALAVRDPGTQEYAEARCREIEADIAAMGEARESLTSEGAVLWDALVSRVGARA
jgi:hypothetical protein